MDSHSKAEAAFEDIIGHYQERLGATSLSPMQLSTTYDFGAPQVTRSSSLPSSSDFVADVELAARAALTEREFKVFLSEYKGVPMFTLTETESFRSRFAIERRSVVTKLGHELIRRKMSSLVEYLTPTPRPTVRA